MKLLTAELEEKNQEIKDAELHQGCGALSGSHMGVLCQQQR